MMRTTPLSNVLRGLLLLSLSPLALPGQNSNPNYRPGVTDPAGNSRNLTLFRDEQIYSVGLPSATGNPWRSASMGFDANLTPTSTVTPLPWSSDLSVTEINAQTAVGRIVHQDKDDIFVVQRSGANQSTLVGRFADNSGSTNIASSILDRVPGYADFFSVSAGDLDNLYDADGNYHDEVVVAWTELEPGVCGLGTVVPHLGVLNYNSKDPSNPTMTSVRVDRADGSYYNVCNLEGYGSRVNNGYPTVPTNITQPGDNIVATAIGDFDGDGQNEIALAYMRNGGTYAAITVVIYRYLNDGTTASLTPVNSYDLSIPNSAIANSSMVATVSLAAGNFDGSGLDQLVVGTAAWWGTVGSNGEYNHGTFISKPAAFLLTAGQTQGSITAAASSGGDNSTTNFTVKLGSDTYVPRTVTIAGAIGSWAAINGTWQVTPTTNGFTLDIDSSAFGSFSGQTVSVTTAAPLTQADFATFEPIPGTTSGGIEIDDTDVDAFIRVQVLPGLFHFDPNNGFDYRRRQIAMAWNSRAAVRYTNLTQDGDPHLAILQITNDDKIQLAFSTNALIGSWQTFQTLSMVAGALRGNNDTNDPTWSLYFSGNGAEFDHNQPFGSRNVYQGMVAAVWKVSPVAGDPTKLNAAFVCSDKATADSYSPTHQGAPEPVCPIWVDAETAVNLASVVGRNTNYLRLPSVAADLNGNSLKLGAPVHFELTNPVRADFILEQPPQHAAWLNLGSGASVVTINRYPTFNTAMQDTQNKSFSTNDQDHTDWTAGGSLTLSASATIEQGIPAAPLIDEGEKVKTSVTTKVAYDYSNSTTSYNSNYSSYTIGTGAVTGEDDSVVAHSQVTDLWRYRIYGQGTDTGDPNNPNAFYEIVLPGPTMKINPGGRDADWYQPVHEVGNILSYPGRTDVCGANNQGPADIGPITIPNTDITDQAVPLISCAEQFSNGNATTLSLALDTKTGNGGSNDYHNNVSADLDISASVKAHVKAFGVGFRLGLSADVDVHGGKDWGHLHTSDNSTSDATGITINSPQVDSNYSYPYYPILYNTESGGLKVAYGVGDLRASQVGSIFWIDHYAAFPDPALNLPNRFDATYSINNILNGWKPETTIARKGMKGFVVRKATINPVMGTDGEYPLLGNNPEDGDTVLLDTRVYNYSISSTPASFTVQFSVIPYNSDIDSEVCANIPAGAGRVCPASARTIIGSGNTSPDGHGNGTFTLNGRENTDAYLLWNTQDFGPQSAGFNEYRVYVDLVSNTQELYPPETPCAAVPCEDNFANENNVDPGQNNEGWSVISVAKRLSGGPLGGRSEALPTHGTLDTGSANVNAAQEFGSAVETANRKTPKRPKPPKKPQPLVAYLHQPLRLRLTAFSSTLSNLHGDVSIFDGKPDARNSTTIAAKTVHGVSPDGTSTWFTWTPRKKGPHHLYAVIHKATGITPLGEVVVNVRRAPGDLNEDGRVDRHDLNMLTRDLNKTVAARACGEECDLDGDGKITQKDADLMAQLCDSESCAFATMEYVGGPSSAEPDMRALRSEEDAASAAFLTAHPEDKELMSSSDQATGIQLYRAELQRKQSVRGIHYWYKGKPVTSGPFATGKPVHGTDKGAGS